MKAVGKFALAIMILIGLFSCEEETVCPIDKQVDLRAGFYQRIDSADQDTSLNNLTIYGLGAEDSLYSNSNNLDEVLLPLSPFADSSRFILMSAGVTETLTFLYERELVFFSEDCGFLHEFTLQDYKLTGSLIDSIAIVEEEVNTENNEHVKIYL